MPSQWGGRREGSGRKSLIENRPDRIVEKLRVSYKEKYPLYSSNQIDTLIIAKSIREGRPDIRTFIETGNVILPNNTWDILKAKKLYDSGTTLQEISEIVGAPSPDTVFSALKKYGYVTSKEEKEKLIRKLFKEGKSDEEISKKLRIGIKRVRIRLADLYLEEANITLPTPSWEEILENGSISISNGYRRKSRTIYYHGKQYVYSHVLWNVHYPDDIVKSNELVHHKDEDPLNDCIGNYEKLTRGDHKQRHKKA